MGQKKECQSRVHASLQEKTTNFQDVRMGCLHQAVISPPPKPPDPTNGHTWGSHEHRGYEGEVDAELEKDINLIKASLKEKTTKGTLPETGQDESNSDPLKARVGCKPKKRREYAPQLPQALDYSTPGADSHNHPSGKPPHLGREVRNSTKPD